MIDRFDANSSRELKALDNDKVIDIDGDTKESSNTAAGAVGFTIDSEDWV